MEKHINVLSILWIVSGILGILGAFFILLFFFGISFLPDMDVEGPIILRTVGLIVAFFVGILSIPDIIAGYWLNKRREWARIFVIILSFLNILWFPFGTAISVYSLVILLREDTAKLFK
ncbi:MAG: hypothetical protein JXB26_06310 [Candidatus Aminicenantes bacterium]|nr:hypothetical protein [Candidatus Aminicenantes bacterium]